MTTHVGTDGGAITAARDQDGVYVRARYDGSAMLSPAAARSLAAELLALADEADAWMNAATGPYRP